MSFDIILIDATRSKTVDEALRLISEVIARHDGKLVRMPLNNNVWLEYIELADGSRIDWYGPSEMQGDTGAKMIPRGGNLAGLCRLLYDLAASVHWVIAPTMKGGVFLRAAESRDVPIQYEDFPETTIIMSAGELEKILSSGLGDWIKYRDHTLSQ